MGNSACHSSASYSSVTRQRADAFARILPELAAAAASARPRDDPSTSSSFVEPLEQPDGCRHVGHDVQRVAVDMLASVSPAAGVSTARQRSARAIAAASPA